MFVASVRAGTLRFFAVILASVALLSALVFLVPEISPVGADTVSASASDTVNYEKVRDNGDRIAFLAQFGWEVEDTPAEETTVTVPKDFDKVFAAYNELQKKQGLDLSLYGGKTVDRYTYTVKNYEGYDGEVLANLLVYRGTVIGGDICSAEATGFLHGFQK